MVGRSKPTKNMVRQSNVEFNTAENLYLKAKNIELAKALADSKNAYSQIVEERDFLQRELFAANLRNTKLDNYIKNIDSAARACINTIVTSSNHVTEILQIANSVQRLTTNETLPFRQSESHTSVLSNIPNSSPRQSNKTQAVKPMIGGHVILRPTINLRRVNEIPIEEIQRLQSSTNNDDSNDDSSSGGSQNEESPPTASSFRCLSGRGNTRAFRNYQPSQSELTEDHEVEEFTDHSSEMSDLGSRLSNGLGTVLEEQESQLTNSLTNENINSQTNASSSSINIPGTSSQVPLLSGVFRDVRVYLSPMQNMAQYIDPRQNVTKERGSSKSHKSTRSQSIHLTRSAENVHRASVESRKRPVDTLNSLAQNSVNVNGSLQSQSSCTISNANTSAETSCNSTLQSPILTSTKISSAKSARNESSSYANSSGWQNKFENSNDNKTQPNNTNSAALNASNETWTPFTSKALQAAEFSRQSHSISKSKPTTSTTDYDPMEGPSTMLDSFDEDDLEMKIKTLSRLGLAPTSLENNTSTPNSPWSPAAAVLQRRERELKKSDDTTPKLAKKSMHVTKRRSIEKKKASLVSSKVAKIVIKRMSLSKYSGSPKKRSLESLKRKSSESPKRKSSMSPNGKTLPSPKRKSLLSLSPKQSLPSPKRENAGSSKKAVNRPAKRKVATSSSKAQRNTKSANVTLKSKSSTESARTNSTSSQKLPKKRETKSKTSTPTPKSKTSTSSMKSKTLTPSSETDSKRVYGFQEKWEKILCHLQTTAQENDVDDSEDEMSLEERKLKSLNKCGTPTTPGKSRVRTRRPAQQRSLKEPSLRKKMRRSK